MYFQNFAPTGLPMMFNRASMVNSFAVVLLLPS
jgi:hypothetical protein